ncbi:MAG: hypothetical protein AAGC93_17560 [Cyanobacteria bacterium P01_F01_bin.53]
MPVTVAGNLRDFGMLRQLKNPAVGLASLSSLLCCALPAEAQVTPTAGVGDVGTVVSGTADFR